MKAAKTWCLAGLILVAGLSSASCGKDEGTDGGGGRGMIIGGSAGSGGSPVGRSGSSTGGSGGGVATAATKLGQACVNDNQCDDPDAPGLTCVTSKDTVLANGAPPKGLCTKTCTMPEVGEVDTCLALGPGGMCVPFEANTDQGYCLEGCRFGKPDIGEPAKCHDRSDFTCNAALFGDTKEPCTTDDDCQSPDFCGSTGTCIVYATACMPSCRGDLDCNAGMYCDQSYSGGTCVTKEPVGKPLNAPCTVPAADAADEPDDCVGWCRPDAAGSSKGHCAATCGIGNECSWNPATKQFDGFCLYASFLTVESGYIGDIGGCTPTCNCAADCDRANVGCELLGGQPLGTDFKAPGLCFAPDETSVVYDQCGDGGAGGGAAGGAGGADSGTGGAAAGESSGGNATGGAN